MSRTAFKALPALLLAVGCHVCSAADTPPAPGAGEPITGSAMPAAAHQAPPAQWQGWPVASATAGQTHLDSRCRQLTKSARCTTRGGSAPRRS